MNPTLLVFDYALFIANPQFSQYGNPGMYPPAILQAWWNNAINYISNTGNCGNIQGDQRYYAIELMLAHLLFLNGIVISGGGGQVPGMLERATIDKVTVGMTPPPMHDQWDWWLGLSPYGQLLLAMLQANTVGGDYIGGSSPRAGFSGTFGGWWGGGGCGC